MPRFALSPLDLQPVPEIDGVDLHLTVLPLFEPKSEPTPSDVVTGVLGQLVPVEEVVESEGEGVASAAEPEQSPEPIGLAAQAQTIPSAVEPIFQTPPATVSTLDSRALL